MQVSSSNTLLTSLWTCWQTSQPLLANDSNSMRFLDYLKKGYAKSKMQITTNMQWWMQTYNNIFAVGEDIDLWIVFLFELSPMKENVYLVPIGYLGGGYPARSPSPPFRNISRKIFSNSLPEKKLFRITPSEKKNPNAPLYTAENMENGGRVMCYTLQCHFNMSGVEWFCSFALSWSVIQWVHYKYARVR